MNLAESASRQTNLCRNRGYAMAALLIAMSVMAILFTVALPTWKQTIQREKEEELIFRGNQYSRAIAAYQRKYANASPATIDVLIEQHYLRKKFKDPMAVTEDGEFQPLYAQTQSTPNGGAQAGTTGTQASTNAFGRRHHRRRQQEHRPIDQGIQRAHALQRVAVHSAAAVDARRRRRSEHRAAGRAGRPRTPTNAAGGQGGTRPVTTRRAVKANASITASCNAGRICWNGGVVARRIHAVRQEHHVDVSARDQSTTTCR